jgi:hypothetical protein
MHGIFDGKIELGDLGHRRGFCPKEALCRRQAICVKRQAGWQAGKNT